MANRKRQKGGPADARKAGGRKVADVPGHRARPAQEKASERAEAPRKPARTPEKPQPQRPLTRHQGDRPRSLAPVVLEIGGEKDYRLIDSGEGEKLERYGPHLIVRPEAQALWPRRLDDRAWARADAIFTGDTEEDGLGRWAFPHAPLGETWPMRLMDIDFHGRLTSFRHVGVFPEQLAHWRWMAERVGARKGTSKALNLFGYTGVASLAAAKAGAEVTHVDASKKAIGWARGNQALAGLEDRPIRWICDDAMKFLLREERRGNRYDLILADPPKFGRGPNGEVWQLFDHLPLMLDLCRSLLSERPIGLVLTAYSIRASFFSIHELMRETMRGAGGQVESGELIIREAGDKGAGDKGAEGGRALSTSLFSRWTPDA